MPVYKQILTDNPVAVGKCPLNFPPNKTGSHALAHVAATHLKVDSVNEMGVRRPARLKLVHMSPILEWPTLLVVGKLFALDVIFMDGDPLAGERSFRNLEDRSASVPDSVPLFYLGPDPGWRQSIDCTVSLVPREEFPR